MIAEIIVFVGGAIAGASGAFALMDVSCAEKIKTFERLYDGAMAENSRMRENLKGANKAVEEWRSSFHHLRASRMTEIAKYPARDPQTGRFVKRG